MLPGGDMLMSPVVNIYNLLPLQNHQALFFLNFSYIFLFQIMKGIYSKPCLQGTPQYPRESVPT